MTGLAASEAGLIYTAELFGGGTPNSRIQKFGTTGVFERMWGKNVDPNNIGMGFELCFVNCQEGESGSGQGELHFPQDVETNAAGNVYVAEFENDRVQVFNPNGGLIGEIGGTSGDGAGELDGLSAIGIDSQGNLYMGEATNRRISKFTSAGAFVSAWGEDVNPSGGSGGHEICTTQTGCQAASGGGDAEGEFNTPLGIGVDSNNDVYVADDAHNRVQKFTSGGSFLATFGWSVTKTLGENFQVCTDATPNVDDCEAGSAGIGNGQFDQAWDVAIDCKDNVYVSDGINARVQKFGDPANGEPPCLAPPTPNPPSPPALTLTGSGKQKAAKLKVKASCGGPACEVSFNGGKATVPKRGASAAKSAKFKLKSKEVSLAAGETKTVKLKFKKHSKTAKKIGKLIKKGGKKAKKRSKVVAKATATSAGGADSAKKKIKLKR